MREIDYCFALGNIGVMEKKICPPQALKDSVSLSSREIFLKLREYFFLPWDYKEDERFLEEVFLKEKKFLENICFFLLPQEHLRGLLKEIFVPRDWPIFPQEPWGLTRQALGLYLKSLNIINHLRASFYNLEGQFYNFPGAEDFQTMLEKKDFLSLEDNLRKFYSEAKMLLEKNKNYLLEFLIKRFLLEFLEEKKRVLLGPQIVFWFYLAKNLNLDVCKFLIMGKFYNLREEILKEAIERVYG